MLAAAVAAAACPGEKPGTPAPLGADTIRLTIISAGHQFTCGLARDSTAWCWGANQYGQLGTPPGAEQCRVDLLATGACSQVPVAVSGGHHFAVLDAGSDHACGVKADGSVYCWGNNGTAQLGVDQTGGVCPVETYAKDRIPPEMCARIPPACEHEGAIHDDRGG